MRCYEIETSVKRGVVAMLGFGEAIELGCVRYSMDHGLIGCVRPEVTRTFAGGGKFRVEIFCGHRIGIGKGGPTDCRKRP